MAKMPNPLPNNLKNEVHSHVRSILEAPNKKTALMLLRETISLYEDKALEAGLYNAATVLSRPEKYGKRLRRTNSIEGLNEEIRRQERVIRIFPNRESVIRLLGALLMEQDEKWTTGKKYSDMEEYLNWCESNTSVETLTVTKIF